MDDIQKVLDILANTPASELAKAVKDAKGLEGIRIIKDLWEDMHAIPERNTTKTGPAMHSSGAGADIAIDNYSNPAPQVGIAEQYQKFTEQNIEGFGRMASSMKAMSDTISAGFGALTDLLSKAEEDKKEEKKEKEMKAEKKSDDEDKKEKKHDKDEEGHGKSLSEKLASIWDQLGELELAYSKSEASDTADIDSMIEKAEGHLETAEANPAMGNQEAVKAMVFINNAWDSLAKATSLNRYDLQGTGNQEDAQVPGDSTSDRTKKDLKAAKSKAAYFSAKTDRLEKALGLNKAEDKKDEKKEEKKEEAKADTTPTTAPIVEAKSEELEALKTQLDKNSEFMKSVNERIAFLTKRQEEVTGQKTPQMLPIVFKSGVASETQAQHLNNLIVEALDKGDLTEENAMSARNFVDRLQAANKGHTSIDIVRQQLKLAPFEVQNFFKPFENNA